MPDDQNRQLSPKRERLFVKRALFLIATDTLAGAERVSITLAKYCAENELFDTVDLFVLSGNPSGSLAPLKAIENMNIIYSGGLRERNGVLPFLRFVFGRKYDFTFSSMVHLNSFCSLLRRIGVLKTHVLIARESTSIFSHPAFEGSFSLKALMAFYGRQDLIICQTDTIEDQFNKGTNFRHKDYTVVIPNFIDQDRIQTLRSEKFDMPPSHDPDNINIVWCGSLTERKNPMLAIEAMKLIADRANGDCFHLFIVGKGHLAGELTELVNANGLDRHITLCGHFSNPIALMAQCQLGLMTSNLEGFPNAMLEMLACGVEQVVITDCAGGLRDVPGVRVVPRGDAERCAQEILASATIKNNQKDLAQFFEKRTVSYYFSTIEKCVQNAR